MAGKEMAASDMQNVNHRGGRTGCAVEEGLIVQLREESVMKLLRNGRLMLIKIGIIGPECSGKSTLAEELVRRLGGYCVPEYARQYVQKLGGTYTYEDVCHIAERNREEAGTREAGTKDKETGDKVTKDEEARENGTKDKEAKDEETKENGERDGLYVFFDTELIVTKVWFDAKYGCRPEWITEPIPQDCRMDAYLILSPDIIWAADSVRENGSDEARQRLFSIYKTEAESTGMPCCVISGTGEQRTNRAIAFITHVTKTLQSRLS